MVQHHVHVRTMMFVQRKLNKNVFSGFSCCWVLKLTVHHLLANHIFYTSTMCKPNYNVSHESKGLIQGQGAILALGLRRHIHCTTGKLSGRGSWYPGMELVIEAIHNGLCAFL